MGLNSTIQKAAQVAFKAIGDITRVCVYTSKGTSTYNATTGSHTSVDDCTEYLNCLFEDFSTREITESGGSILSTDQKASIPAPNLISIYDDIITPKILDYIVDENEQKWVVQQTNIDSARALWVLQVRRAA